MFGGVSKDKFDEIHDEILKLRKENKTLKEDLKKKKTSYNYAHGARVKFSARIKRAIEYIDEDCVRLKAGKNYFAKIRDILDGDKS